MRRGGDDGWLSRTHITSSALRPPRRVRFAGARCHAEHHRPSTTLPAAPSRHLTATLPSTSTTLPFDASHLKTPRRCRSETRAGRDAAFRKPPAGAATRGGRESPRGSEGALLSVVDGSISVRMNGTVCRPELDRVNGDSRSPRHVTGERAMMYVVRCCCCRRQGRGVPRDRAQIAARRRGLASIYLFGWAAESADA